jgi:hypothetical protein
MPRKPKTKAPKLLPRSMLVTEEMDNALNTEAANRGWGKTKLVRMILVAWLEHWRATKRPIRLPDIDKRQLK